MTEEDRKRNLINWFAENNASGFWETYGTNGGTQMGIQKFG